MSWLLFTIIAIVSRATYSLGTRILSRDIKVSPVTQSFLLTLSVAILVLIASPLIGGLDFTGVNNNLSALCVIIATSVVGNILYFIGQKKLDTGATQIAFSSILIWGTLLSMVFLQSVFTYVQFIGILVLLIAILLAQHKKGKITLSAHMLSIVASAVLFALFQVASAKISTTISTASYVFISSLGTALMILLLYFNQVKNDCMKLLPQAKTAFLRMLFASGTSSLYLVFSFLAYKNAPDPGVVVVFLTSQVIFSVLFGILFLKERENMGKIIVAGVLACIAGVLIKA